jgi:ABC-2 type transport system ATP-binding protein
VERGEFVAYAGPNGAGKSTTIKLLGGMLMQSAGEITALGLSPVKHRIPLMRKLGVLFGNRTELWWDHPVASSYRWKKAVWNIADKDFNEMEAMVLDLLDIKPFYHTFARELSLGQRMRADLGMTLLHRPELILLDEPTLGLDVLAKRQMIKFLKELNETEKTTVIVTSHDMDDLEEMANRIILIAEGVAAFDGGFTELRGKLGCDKLEEGLATLFAQWREEDQI